MSAPEDVAVVVQEWAAKAENDLLNAAYTLRLGEDCPVDTVCFHAQQCVEKYLKAFLCLDGIDFPKTHDIGSLLALLPPQLDPGLTPEESRQLTGYATFMRYPGDYEPITLAEARRAVQMARRVRRAVRRLLPKPPRRRKH